LRFAPADTDRVSVSVGLFLIVLVTFVIGGVGIIVVGRARRAVRGSGQEGLASRAGTQRLLAENWALVEKSARESGMTEDEIARVRENILGVGGG
jgi:hypothetical protein